MAGYTGSSGAMEAWVKIPTLSASGELYMCVGNSAITTFQGGSAGAAWNSNYQAVYHMSTATVNDSTSHANNASSIDSPTSSTGEIGNGINFVASSVQFLTTPISDPSFGGSSNGTVSWWAYNGGSYNDSTEYYWWGSDNSGTLWDFSCLKYTDNNLYCGWITSTSTRVTVAASAANFPHNTWTHYALTWVSGGTSTFYVNGSSIGTYSGTSVGNVTDDIRIGANHNQPGPYQGNMDEWRIASTNLSANWIATEHNNQSAPGTFAGIGALTAL
jgi:hypothetical protein